MEHDVIVIDINGVSHAIAILIPLDRTTGRKLRSVPGRISGGGHDYGTQWDGAPFQMKAKHPIPGTVGVNRDFSNPNQLTLEVRTRARFG